MKWEILKGSGKDFEGAPDGAIYVLELFGSKTFVSSNMRTLEEMECGIMPEDIRNYCIAERRPITEPDVNQQVTTEWSGEGLPPVGVECEIKRVFDWVPVIIKYISGYYTVTQAPDGAEQAYQTSALQFRHILSPKDVARDAAAEAMRDSVLSS